MGFMTGVVVDFPVEEAEAVLEELGKRPIVHIGPPVALMDGYRRLKQAVAVERGPSGNAEESPTVKEQAEALVGYDVVIRTVNALVRGRLAGISATDQLLLETGPTSHRPIRISAVREISADLGEAA